MSTSGFLWIKQKKESGIHTLESSNGENKGLIAHPCEKELCNMVKACVMKRGLYWKPAQRSYTVGGSYT